jgi:hypothetical protein
VIHWILQGVVVLINISADETNGIETKLRSARVLLELGPDRMDFREFGLLPPSSFLIPFSDLLELW